LVGESQIARFLSLRERVRVRTFVARNALLRAVFAVQALTPCPSPGGRGELLVPQPPAPSP